MYINGSRVLDNKGFVHAWNMNQEFGIFIKTWTVNCNIEIIAYPPVKEKQAFICETLQEQLSPCDSLIAIPKQKCQLKIYNTKIKLSQTKFSNLLR